ncbi:MAG: hypothetical protein WBB94_00035, partial [Candidatus Saccharimonadaceae bacterium]
MMQKRGTTDDIKASYRCGNYRWCDHTGSWRYFFAIPSDWSKNSGIRERITKYHSKRQPSAVKKGQTVTVKNQSSDELEFASDEHPSHRQQPELNIGSTAAGASTTFTPTKTGTWGFHDHIRSQFT